MNKIKQKVIVGMSGGVDSSVAAALLVEEGFDVKGVFMKNWQSDEARFNDVCPWEDDLRDAKAVAARLDIPIEVWNFEREYYDNVVKYLITEYQAGRTPNPDVMCNKEIKFKLFLNKALSEGTDYIATGHYARIIQENGQTHLYAGVDGNKDQSYFLYAINSSILPKLKMPIGMYTKPKIRELAKKFNLPNWDKKDSQGICFIGKINLKEFLQTKLPIKKGEVITTDGQVVGQHDGVWFYTEGQREGIGLRGGTEPYYVIRKDIKSNQLIVGPKQNQALYHSEFLAENVNWLTDMPREFTCLARVRYRSALIKCGVNNTKADQIKIKLEVPERAIARGQSVVLYHDNGLVLGGGVIR